MSISTDTIDWPGSISWAFQDERLHAPRREQPALAATPGLVTHDLRVRETLSFTREFRMTDNLFPLVARFDDARIILMTFERDVREWLKWSYHETT